MTGAGGRRRAAAAGILSGSVVLALAIFVLVNWLGSRHWARGDWTKARLYSLSDTTRKIVKDLKAPVDITVFMTRDARLYTPVEELLNRYRALSSRIHVEELDPRRNLARAQALVQKYNVRQNTVVFQSGDRKKYVTEDEMADFSFSGMPGQGSSLKSFKGEQAFTSAILAVTSAKSPKIYFTAGHGERSPSDAGESGFSDVRDLLAKDNDTVDTWDSLGKAEVPKDADLVVVAGPRTALLAPERDALDKYLGGGGRVLFLVDPVIPALTAPPPDLGLGSLLKEWGVQLDDDIVVDPGNSLPFIGAETVYANHFGTQEIVSPLSSANMAVIFPLARSVTPVASSHAGFTATTLVETTAEGWGETDLQHLSAVGKDDRDVKAPVSLGVAGEESKSASSSAPGGAARARVVVFGDSDFASNSNLRSVSNATLFLNSVHWLTGSENLVGIGPKTPEEASLTLSRGQLRTVGLLSILGIPGLALLAGILVWVRRRR
jgi:ABC-type uncharacterized transport system involved in gliding motility auxiliary subunit